MKYLTLLLGIVLLLGCAQQGGTPSNQAGGETPITPPQTALTAKIGDNVSVDYVLTLENGTVVDTSLRIEAERTGLPKKNRYTPLAFQVGSGQLITGFENAVIGMKEGEEKTVLLPEENGYGPYLAEKVIMVANDGKLKNVTVGTYIQTTGGDVGIVTAINATNVTIDFNHPMAGKNLNFRIILRKIN